MNSQGALDQLSHHSCSSILSQSLQEPGVALGKGLEPFGRTGLCPSLGGKQNHGIILSIPRAQGSCPGDIPVPAGATSPVSSREPGTGNFLCHSMQAGPALLAGSETFHPSFFFFFLGLGLRTWFLLAAWKELDVFCPNNPQRLGLILTAFGGTESQVQHEGWREAECWEGEPSLSKNLIF